MTVMLSAKSPAALGDESGVSTDQPQEILQTYVDANGVRTEMPVGSPELVEAELRDWKFAEFVPTLCEPKLLGELRLLLCLRTALLASEVVCELRHVARHGVEFGEVERHQVEGDQTRATAALLLCAWSR